ncbi:MAG: AMP-binding protein [Chlorobi bacterium]|nr:AMP-binding protein [Chlorobiota bacterium]
MYKTILEPEHELSPITVNIAEMLRNNVKNFSTRYVFKQKQKNKYFGITWQEFYTGIRRIAFNLQKLGFSKGDKALILSRNRLEMLQTELAIQSSGGISVPVFHNLKEPVITKLYQHSGSKYLFVGSEVQLGKISQSLSINKIFSFDEIKHNNFPELIFFKDLIAPLEMGDFSLDFNASPEDICLNMYTSGTMGEQKCVQLTHKNILSQQAALDVLWDVDENDRLLSYLPWHHSFGGIFEKFTAIYSGAEMYLESGYGTDPKEILENWKLVKPTIFFSVPLVYQSLYTLAKESKEAEELFFHPDLKFIFTAAAPLPKNISDEFENRGVKVIEGWGLTETTPCCTLTDPKVKRAPGVVGKPIPGVKLRLAEDGEIQVSGPNVMKGYYNNKKANDKIFTPDGWFCTGDIGEFTETGLKLIARKDRIFKLLNAEKIIPADLEKKILGKCSYLSYVLVEGSGRKTPIALLFPNNTLVSSSAKNNNIKIEGCKCPENMKDLAVCLKQCIDNVNNEIKEKYARINCAMLINGGLSVEDKTLTASMKMMPNSVKHVFKAHIQKIYGEDKEIKEDFYIIPLQEEL